MKAKTLIPLILVLAVLVGIVVYQRSTEEEPTLAEQTAFEALVPESLNASDVSKVEMYTGGKPDEKVVLEEVEDGKWRVASHFNAPADADAVKQYLEKVTGLQGEFRAEADSAEKLATYDLSDEKAFHVLAYTGAEEPAVHLLVGKAPDNNTVFLREESGSRIYTEGSNLRREAGVYSDDAETAPTADKWLDKNVIEVAKDKVTKIALNTPDKDLVFEKVTKETPPAEPPAEGADAETPPPAAPAEYEWKLASGGFAPQHKEAGLNKILDRLAALTANNVVDPAKKEEFGLADPAFTATITVEGQEDDVVLKGGRPDPKGSGYLFKADNPDVVYEVSQFNFEQIFPKGSELFDLAAPVLNKDEITRIEVAQPEGNVVLAKQGEVWQVEAPVTDLDVQRTKVDGVANALSTWKPADYVDPAKAPTAFDKTVTVTTGATTHTLQFGGQAKGVDGSYVKVDGSDQVFVMSTADVGRIAVAPKDVYQLKALNVMQSTINKVDAQVNGESLTMLQAGENWNVMSGGKTGQCGADACTEFLTTVANFQATGIAPGAMGLAQPVATITLTQNDGPSHTLSFGPAENGMHALQVSGKNTILTVSEEAFAPIVSGFNAVRDNIQEAPAPAEPPADAAAPTAPETPATVVMPVEGAAAPAPGEMPSISISPTPAEGSAVEVTATPEPMTLPEPADAPAIELAPSNESAIQQPLAPEQPVPAPEVMAPAEPAPAPTPEVMAPAEPAPAPTPEAAAPAESAPAIEDDAAIQSGAPEEAAPEEAAPAPAPEVTAAPEPPQQ
ncbi:MAG: DUF4340 domain-containing protein [Candidatus Hydrogenedentes bacterium]|nr:DUF4340 domain-containing protein [Candidatus Hydrogenedentota bacterium]